MNVPGGSAKPLSRTQSSKPARDFSSHRPSLFMRPDDSVYRERTSFPSALMRIILEIAFGLSGTPSCRLANVRPEPRRTTNTTIFPAKHACARFNTHWPDLVRSIGNAQPLTRRIRFRSIGNASLRLPKNLIRSIRNARAATPQISFSVYRERTPATPQNLIRSIRNAQPQVRRFPFRSMAHAPLRLAKNPFRSIRNDLPQTRRFPFRSIGNDRSVSLETPIRPIRNSGGLSGTKLRSIRYESTVYRERIFGLSGTHPCRKPPLRASLALLTGGLTFLTHLTSLTSPALQFIRIPLATTVMIFWEEGKHTNFLRSRWAVARHDP
jgi:hypothetical protein